MFKHLRLIPLLTLLSLLPAICAAQGLGIDQGIKRSPLNFTRDNYVSPEEYAETLGLPGETQAEQNQESTEQESKTDPNGPWMICKITAYE